MFLTLVPTGLNGCVPGSQFWNAFGVAFQVYEMKWRYHFLAHFELNGVGKREHFATYFYPSTLTLKRIVYGYPWFGRTVLFEFLKGHLRNLSMALIQNQIWSFTLRINRPKKGMFSYTSAPKSKKSFC